MCTWLLEAAQTSEKAIARILKTYRIRRLNAAEVLRILRQPPLVVAPGTTQAATAHIRTIAARLRLINQQRGVTAPPITLYKKLGGPTDSCKETDPWR